MIENDLAILRINALRFLNTSPDSQHPIHNLFYSVDKGPIIQYEDVKTMVPGAGIELAHNGM